VVHLTDEARARRVKWCQDQQELATNWDCVVFSDESWFELGMHKQYIWRHENEFGPDVCCAKHAHPPKVMIWGAIGHNFKSSLHVVHGNINGDYYLNRIIFGNFANEAIEAYGRMEDGRPAFIFQHDNARPHIRRDVIAAIENTGIQILKPWPAYSPDLNVIERIWAIMKRRVEIENPQSASDLEDTVQRVWDNLGVDLINSLVAEMPRRLVQVIANEGRTIQRL
jgi:hypothetical protein